MGLSVILNIIFKTESRLADKVFSKIILRTSSYILAQSIDVNYSPEYTLLPFGNFHEGNYCVMMSYRNLLHYNVLLQCFNYAICLQMHLIWKCDVIWVLRIEYDSYWRDSVKVELFITLVEVFTWVAFNRLYWSRRTCFSMENPPFTLLFAV